MKRWVATLPKLADAEMQFRTLSATESKSKNRQQEVFNGKWTLQWYNKNR